MPEDFGFPIPFFRPRPRFRGRVTLASGETTDVSSRDELNEVLRAAIASAIGAEAVPTAPGPTVTIPPPSTPPPSSPPTVTPPPAPSSPPPSAGVSDESIRQQAERIARDTEIRRSAPPQIKVPGGARGGSIFEGEVIKRAGGGIAKRIGGAIAGPIGVIIGEAIFPSELGSGEVSPDELERNVERERVREETLADEIARDVLRGGGIIGAGTIIGGGILIDQVGRFPLPMPLPDDATRRGVDVEVPRVDIPTPVIRQPGPLPMPQPPVPAIGVPAPAKRPVKTPVGTRSTPTPTRGMPKIGPIAAPQLLGLAGLGLGLGLRGSTRRSSLTVPRSLTSTPIANMTNTPLPTSSPTSSPLTGLNTGLLSSSPPRSPTATRTRECDCRPKRRKPERECRARANVVWAGGPNIGKPAGTRCISFKK